MFRLPILTALGLATLAQAAPPPRQILEDSKTVLVELTDGDKAIPAKLLQEAEAVVIVPNTIKVGLGIGGRIGHGVAVVKEKGGGWGEIRFVDLGGASVGFQAGVQSTDVVLVFKNRKGLDRLLDGKAKLKLGADASVAAGPVGREAEVGTDLLLKSEIFSYSRARGLFAGVSLDGVVLNGNGRRTADFEKDAGEQTRKAADELKKAIAIAVAGKTRKELPLAVVPGAAPAPMPVPVPMSMPLPVPPPTVPVAPPPTTIPPAALPPPMEVVPPADEQPGFFRRLMKRAKGG